MATIEQLIRKTAENKIAGKYNLPQYKKGGKREKERENAILHKKVCEEIAAFLNSHKEIPCYFALQVGVSKGAFKTSEFKKGYKRFNADEVETVYNFGQMYLKYNGLPKNTKLSDVGIRLIMRFYERVSHKTATFKKALAKSQNLGKRCQIREVEYSYLCQNLGIPYAEKESGVSTAAA